MMLTVTGLSLSNRLEGVSIEVQGGQWLALVGPNGAGKSTLLTAMAGLLAADAGSIVLDHRPIQDYSLAELALKRGFLEQQNAMAFSVTLEETLKFAMEIAGPNGELPRDLLDHLEIGPLLHRPLDALSGGERQRGAIARALIPHWSSLQQGRGLLLLDEPLQGLDLRHQHQVSELLQTLAEAGNGVVTSLHELSIAASYSTHVGLLKQGRVGYCSDTENAMQPQRLSEVFDCKVEALGAGKRKAFSVNL